MSTSASQPLGEKHRNRDLAILRHVAEYGIALAAAVSALFFRGKQAGHVLRKLSDAGDLELFPRALPGSITFARLSKAGCHRIGVSEKLARPISGHALGQAVSLVCYAVLGAHRRMRLTPAELQELFGRDAPHASIPHVLVSKVELGHFAALRVVFAGGSIQETKKQLLRLIEEAAKNPTLSDAMSKKPSYGFLCLCPSESSKQALVSALAKSGVLSEALVLVDLGPSVEGLPAYLKGLKGGGR